MADLLEESKSILGRIAESLDAAAWQAVRSCKPLFSEALLTGWQLGDVTLELGAVQPVYSVAPQPSEWATIDPPMDFRVGAYADVSVRTPDKETARSLWYSDAPGHFQWCEVAVVFKPNPTIRNMEVREYNTLPPGAKAYHALSTSASHDALLAVDPKGGTVKRGKKALDPINEQEFVERWVNLFKEAVRHAEG